MQWKMRTYLIIKVDYKERVNFNVVEISLRNPGLLIGKKGYRITNLSKYLTEKFNKEIIVSPIQHKEWDQL